MGILQINQIVKKIRGTYEALLDFSDISNFSLSKSENIDIAISRGMNAFVIEYLTGCSPIDAALSVTDSADDNGIDALYYDKASNCLYVTQSKYDHDGKGEPDLGAVKKFIGGFNDLIEMKFEKFCSKIKKRQTEIETILDQPDLMVKLLLIYTGINKGPKNIEEFESLKKRLNDLGSEWLSYEFYTQKELYDILTSSSVPSIDVDLMIHNFGLAEISTPKAFYGQVAASDIGELWKLYGTKLFSSNIRNLLPKSEINERMLQTLKTAGRLFWYYNNGITIICDHIDKNKKGGSTRDAGIFNIKNMSVVNGAQTTGTIGSYYATLNDDEIEMSLADTYVQVKIIQTKDDDGLEVETDFSKSITINNNMQNKIVARDFASQSDVQKRLKIELEQEGITYHISRGENEISNTTNCTTNEAGRSRCNTLGIKYVMIAHRGINIHLFKNMDSNEYNAVFNNSITGIGMWNTILIQRAIDEILAKERKKNPNIKEILIYGKDYLSYIAFQKYWKTISSTTIVEIKEEEKEKIATYIVDIANKISKIIPSFGKVTRNIFQSESDVETLHGQILHMPATECTLHG